jgi:hypothetical protein
LLALPLQRSGFNRFYQYFRWKTPIAGKTFAHKNKRPGTTPGSLFKLLTITQTLAMSMMVVMTTMMTAIRIRRNHRTSENNDCNGSKK